LLSGKEFPSWKPVQRSFDFLPDKSGLNSRGEAFIGLVLKWQGFIENRILEG
jgi:hypothetical protein